MTAPKRPAPKRPAPKCPRAQTAAPKRRRPEVTYPHLGLKNNKQNFIFIASRDWKSCIRASPTTVCVLHLDSLSHSSYQFISRPVQSRHRCFILLFFIFHSLSGPESSLSFFLSFFSDSSPMTLMGNSIYFLGFITL